MEIGGKVEEVVDATAMQMTWSDVIEMEVCCGDLEVVDMEIVGSWNEFEVKLRDRQTCSLFV
jgi:hypothetical protein